MAELIRYEDSGLAALHAWAERGTLHVVLDACDEPRVPAKVRELESRAVPLYQGESQEKLWAIAPYLVQADVALVDWIAQSLWTDPWGVFIVTTAGIEALRTHLRHFLVVDAPNDEQWYFRFYDPRVMARFLATSDAPQLTDFFGPAEAIGWVDTASYGVRMARLARFDDASPRVTYRKTMR
jgi:hypothetical protein